jgi:putative DNA primase/helicase
MDDFKSQLEQYMLEHHFTIRGEINYSLTNKWQRFSDATQSNRSKKNLFVYLHEFNTGASFGDWRDPSGWSTYWANGNNKPSLYAMNELVELKRQRKEEELYQRHKHEWRARTLWNRGFVENEPINHRYIIHKSIFPYHAKSVRSRLLIPISNIDRQLITLQIIRPNGFKHLWKGTSQKGLMIWLWDDVLPATYSGVIRICEGYSTGCTIRAVTQSPVVCAVNAMNMPNVGEQLRRKYPHAMIKICADNDQWGDENTGMQYALRTSDLTNATIYWPTFDPRLSKFKPTDFNDLYVLEGKHEVRNQLIVIRK